LHYEGYCQATLELSNILRLRGLLVQVLHILFNKLLEKQWQNKGSEIEPSLDYLALTTKYNPIYDGIEISPINYAMIKYWGSFTITNQIDLVPIQHFSIIVNLKEVIISETSIAQQLI
jgi:hypothetical protein